MRRWPAVALCLATGLMLSCGTAQRARPEGAALPRFEPVDTDPVDTAGAGTPEVSAWSPSVVPEVPPVSAPQFSPRRPAKVAGYLDAPLRRRWKYIVIHHSGTDAGGEAIFDRYHKEHNHWLGVGYDFVIGNGRGAEDGLVEVTFRWEKQLQGAHANQREYNQHGIGICLVGNLEKDHPTAGQMDALVGLVNYLQERCDIPTDHIVGHRHIRPGGTRCPGRNFPWYEFYSRLNH